MESKPLVSCVMPTMNRPAFAQRAMQYFFEQDYPNRELVILDDGEAIQRIVPTHDTRFKYFWPATSAPVSLGSKRNMLNRLSAGFESHQPSPLIMHWDDDDWYRSNRISEQVELLQAGDYDIVGLNRVLFHKPETDETWLYSYPENSRQRWLAGGTCLYKRSLWERYPFPDQQRGSDTAWICGFDSSVRMGAMLDYGFYVAMLHGGNTNPFIPIPPLCQPWAGDIHALMSNKARVQLV